MFLDRITASRKTLYTLAAFAILSMGATGWDLVYPFTLRSIPVLVVFGYAVFRIVFELTFNRKGIPTMATTMLARHKMAAILKTEAERTGRSPYRIYDLGSGRGELARRIAKTVPSAIVCGLEIAPIPLWQSQMIQRLFGPANLSFRREDIWTFDARDADAIVLYLGPLTTQRMGEKLRAELKPGSLIITSTFPLDPSWEPVEVNRFSSPFKEVFYVYRQAGETTDSERRI